MTLWDTTHPQLPFFLVGQESNAEIRSVIKKNTVLFFVVAQCGSYKEGLIIEALDFVDYLNLKAFLNVKEESYAQDKGELVIRRIWKDMNLSKYGGTCTSCSVWDKWNLKKDGIIEFT